MVTRSDVHAKLGSLSQGKEVMQYHQADLKDTLDHSVKSKVPAGYCTGVGLDWIRRVLLRDVDQDPRKLAFTADDVDKQSQQASRAAKVQVLVRAAFNKLAAENKEKQAAAARLDPHAAQAKAVAQCADLDRWMDNSMAEVKQQLSQNAIDAASYNQRVKDIKQRYNEMFDKIQQTANDMTSAYSAANAQVLTVEDTWKRAFEYCDRVVAADKQARALPGAVKPSTAKFGDLTVVLNKEGQTYNGVAALTQNLLSTSAFAANRAALLTVKPPTANSVGHSVALLRRNNGDYYHFFDPNFGVYVLERSKVQEAMTYLFVTAYPNLGGATVGDNHVYEIDGKVVGEYTIFVGRQPSPPSVTHVAAAGVGK